jgi:hypothetical protein
MLQGQDEAGIASAAGIAASMGAGLLEANRPGGTVKRVHPLRLGGTAAWQRGRALQRVVPARFPAVLRVTTRTGEELEDRVEVNRGGPGNPLSDEELARKFHDNAGRSLPEERAAEIAARTLGPS